ncbi:MAG: exodeoxyribonuclease V subunit alpha [Methylococcales bacterium]|nr:exodeoxyribonuclease V subunit alpha [Methylococcales bacterium]MDP3837418.1 exodeoxyribonuclease V subunit alpha [Methylococcales bacterium]
MTMTTTSPEPLPFSRLDTAFARFLEDRATLNDAQKKAFKDIVLLLSYQHNQGHSCIVLDEDKQALVLASGLAVSASDAAATVLPLVLENNRLYLQRYWDYEHRLASATQTIANHPHRVEQLDDLLDIYFPPTEGKDWQREAARIAVQHSFSIITGGPGTGKTTTVVKILAVLQELAQEPLLIALAAPTGKAAMRLQESIGSNKSALPCSDTIKNTIPETVTTLHRLLGAKPDSPYFRHDVNHPLIHDLVVVDEASMVDLALMSKLMDALKPNARLILLGDKDQLASVESGAVLADLTQALSTHTVELKTAHRFDDNIKQLANTVNEQNAGAAWRFLNSGNEHTLLLQDDLIAYIAAQQTAYLKLIQQGADFTDVYQAFNRFQVLCSNREGKNSVADINSRVEHKLAQNGRIQIAGLWYSGRPVLVTQNNPALHLYNGDIGLCLPDKHQGGKLMVFFQRPDRSVKSYLPSRIAQCETVFAMTIHKSQGSEFEEVLIILPELINPVLTKELLYTAITRAKKTVKLVANEAVFMATIQQKVARVTGLVDKF